MGASFPALATFFTSSAFETAATTAAVSTVAGYGISQLNKPSGVNIPPPPGAALIDPAGQAAASNARRRAAASGGLQSTVTDAQAAAGGPTSGGKALLGQ